MDEDIQTLDQLIAALEKIREEHGGNITVKAFDEIGSTCNHIRTPFICHDGDEKYVFIDAE